jgi:pyridoxine 4-dehydrogenase
MATLTLGEAQLTRIGLGTYRLRNTPEHVAFVRDAVAAGVGLIDTAHTYTGGESEQTIGAALSSSRDGCVVATKGGYGSGRPEVLSAEIDESLRRLRT